MDYKELQEKLAMLSGAMNALEEMYIDNGGEVTEETEGLSVEVEALKDLLSGEGVDMLGAWLRAKEDRKKALKAEMDHIRRESAAVDRTVGFIKHKIAEVMALTGEDRFRGGRGYSFTKSVSCTTSVDKDTLNGMFKERVEELVRGVLPPDVTVTLGASVSAVPEGEELPPYYIRKEEDTVRFTKPRASKETE